MFKPAGSDKPKDSIQDYERDYENQLKEILETIIGVEDVSIVVNVDATSLKVFEKIRKRKRHQLMKRTNRAENGPSPKHLPMKKLS